MQHWTAQSSSLLYLRMILFRITIRIENGNRVPISPHRVMCVDLLALPPIAGVAIAISLLVAFGKKAIPHPPSKGNRSNAVHFAEVCRCIV